MNRIKFYREQVGMTQAELGDTLGYSQGTIGHYEAERRKPGLEDSRGITAALATAGASEGGQPVTLDDVFPPAETAELQEVG